MHGKTLKMHEKCMLMYFDHGIISNFSNHYLDIWIYPVTIYVYWKHYKHEKAADDLVADDKRKYDEVWSRLLDESAAVIGTGGS